jgi:hypothetical protein
LEGRVIARKQKFKDVTIFLDGSSFIECTFERCTFVYSGLMLVALEDNSFKECKWQFSGSAQNTLAFMGALYGGGLHDLIEATFDNIRGKANPAAVITKH